MLDYFNEFIQMLKTATERIEQNYFNMPVTGKHAPIYRERVYCYELYHQLRCLWDDFSLKTFKLCGEVDKKSHPIITREFKPDMIVHEPGTMDNLAVIEVKSCDYDVNDYKYDLEKLIWFFDNASYSRGILLVYGKPNRCQGDIRDNILKAARLLNQVKIQRIEVFHHIKVGEPASKMFTEWPHVS